MASFLTYRVSLLNSKQTMQSVLASNVKLSMKADSKFPTSDGKWATTGPDGLPVVQSKDGTTAPLAYCTIGFNPEHSAKAAIEAVGGFSFASEAFSAMCAEMIVKGAPVAPAGAGAAAPAPAPAPAPAVAAATAVLGHLHNIVHTAHLAFLETDVSVFGRYQDAIRVAFDGIATSVAAMTVSSSFWRSLEAFKAQVGFVDHGSSSMPVDNKRTFDLLQLKKKIAMFFKHNRMIGLTFMPFNFYGQEEYDVGVVTSGMMSTVNYGFSNGPEDDIYPREPVFVLPTARESERLGLLPLNAMMSAEGMQTEVNILATVNEAHINEVCAGLPVAWARELKHSSFLGVSVSSAAVGAGNVLDIHIGGTIGGVTFY